MVRKLLPLLFGFILIQAALYVPIDALAQDYVDEISYTLEQPFGNRTLVTSFGQYLQMVYSYAAGLVGIIAVVLIMAGGMIWITAAGNEQKISTAKEVIVSAVIAVLIIVLSYGILLFINPRLLDVSLSITKIPISDVEDFYDLPKCTDAPYSGKDCTNESASTVKCDNIPCGEIGNLEGTGLCRGGATSCDVANGYGCYRDPGDPRGAMSCRLQICGTRVDDCIKRYDPNTVEYSQCLCGWYIKAMTYFGGGSSLIIPNYDADRQKIYSNLCEESISNEDWPTKVTETPYSTYFTGASASRADTLGLNCGFGSACPLNEFEIGGECKSYCGNVGTLPKCN